MRTLILTLGFLAIAAPALADSPSLKTEAPIIYLADNLDETDQLGWCIDTVGRGYSDRLHVHSCKPRGDDVHFTYEPASGQIRSVPYEGKCAAMTGSDDAVIPLGLRDCDAKAEGQQFDYDPLSGLFAVRAQPSLCLTAGETSRRAGPFMSRDLLLASCGEGDPALQYWLIQN